MISGKTLLTSSLAFLLLAFVAPVSADSIKRIVHPDGTVEYTNVKAVATSVRQQRMKWFTATLTTMA